MKIKVIWEESDIKPGLVIGTLTCTERWVIGYCPEIEGASRYTFISLDDGMVRADRLTKLKLCDLLTEGGYLPQALLLEYGTDHN
jgi:hypothetical protein